MNEQIKVRQTSSTKVRTTTTTILTIGGVDGSFDVTTADLPGAPIISNVTSGSTRATITFSAPASTGGRAITGYTVTSNPAGGVDGNAGTITTTHTITSLANGTAYTFTVTAANAIGTGAASASSNSVTPATVPGAPVLIGVVKGNALVAVTFASPLSNGGSAITGYTVTANHGGKIAIGTTSPLTVTGLTNGTVYTFTVTATNAVGTSIASAVSNSVIPATSTIPTVTITANATPANPSNLASGQIGFSGVNALTFQCKLDNGMFAPCTSPYAYSGLANGSSHTFFVHSFNTDIPPKASAIATYAWKVDTSLPTVSAFTVAVPHPKYINSQKISITALTARDNAGGSGLAGYMITESDTAPLAGDSEWSHTKPAIYTTANTGSVVLYAWVKDKAGNVSAAFVPQTVNIDITKPAVDSFTITSPVSALTVPVTSFTANDLGGSNVTGYLITTTATAPLVTAAGWRATAPISYSVTSAGTKTLYGWARDGAGNVSAAIAPQTVVVDLAKPVVTIFTLASPLNSTTLPVTAFTATDAGGSGLADYMITESPIAPISNDAGWSTTKPASYSVKGQWNPGTSKTIYAWAKDGAGNISLPRPATVKIQ